MAADDRKDAQIDFDRDMSRMQTEAERIRRRLQGTDDAFEAQQLYEQLQTLERQIRSAQSTRDKQVEREAVDKTREFSAQIDPFAERTPEEQAAYEQALGGLDTEELRYSTPDEARRTIGEDELYTSPEFSNTAWAGAESAYGGLAYDPNSLASMGDALTYASDVARSGRDAIGDADYARRAIDAEQVRRGQTEAALMSEEVRGGGGGGRLLADLTATQGQVADMYGAGLNVAANAQRRRDEANATRADIAGRMGDAIYGADRDRAAGLDDFTGQRLDATDTNRNRYEDFAVEAQRYNAGLATDAADTNLSRDWSNTDADRDLYNQTLAYNAQQRGAGLGAYQGALGLEGGQVLGQGGLDLRRTEFTYRKAQDRRNRQDAYVDRVLNAGSRVAGV